MDSTLRHISLDIIDEDPNQPRTEFDQASLLELAETIRARGVKTPISVRPNLKLDGRYIINHGARRFRASKLAAKDTIPAFIDAEYSEPDQLIENLQRENLTPKEIAQFLAKLLQHQGYKKGELARTLGKSPAWVTQHLNLLALPKPVQQAVDCGRCKDVTVAYELTKMLKEYPDQVNGWLEDEDQEISRGSLKQLQQFLGSAGPMGKKEKSVAGAAQEEMRKTDGAASSKHGKPEIVVDIGGREAVLLLEKAPTEKGKAWFAAGEEILEAPVAGVRIIEVRGAAWH